MAPTPPFAGPRNFPTFFAPQVQPIPTFAISGVTRDSTGNALATVSLHLFHTLDDVWAGGTTSDGSGVYTLAVAKSEMYYIVGYKAGSPDVSGTTKNTLTGVNTLTGL